MSATLPPPGIFNLKDSHALYGKMLGDCEAIQMCPTNAAACFNMFVTAYHMVDWHYPHGSEDYKARRAAILDDPHIRICQQIANGGKHHTRRGRGEGAFTGTTHIQGFRVGDVEKTGQQFAVILTSELAEVMGREAIGVVELANYLMKFWKQKLDGD